MTNIAKAFVAVVVATSLLAPAIASATTSSAPRAKIKVHPKRWHGYGFLPGYRPSLAEINGVPVLGADPRPKREMRYFDFYGRGPQYGWGGPGFYRGTYNGGSFGPCWTYTPIGMMPTCGQ